MAKLKIDASYDSNLCDMQVLYYRGGRAFWIHNTGPVGCLPYVLDRFPVTSGQVDKYGCANPFNEMAQYFNQGLKRLVGQLRNDLPLAAITYVDVCTVKYSLISQAKKLGNLSMKKFWCQSFDVN